MFCSRCGTQVNAQYKYCPSCGAPLSLHSSSDQPKAVKKKAMPLWFKLLASLAVLALIAVTAGILFTESWVDVVDHQLEALRQNDISKAYYAYTSKDFQKATSLAQFQDFVQKYPIFLQSQSAHFTQRSIKNKIGTLKGNLTASDHKQIPVEYKLIKEKGKWKILSLRLLNPEPFSPITSSQKQGETEQLIEAIKTQLKKIQDHQWTEVYQDHSQEFKRVTSEKAFQDFIQHYPILTNYHLVSFHKPTIRNGIGSVSVILQSDQAAAYLKYYLVFEEGKWKIVSMRILSPSEEKKETEQASPSQQQPSENQQNPSTNFGAIIVGDQLNEQGEVQESKKTFSSSLKDLYVEIEVQNAEKGQTVYLNLHHEDIGSSIPAKATIEETGETTLLSVFSPPKTGWPKGHYKLTITTSSGLKRDLDFEIQEK